MLEARGINQYYGGSHTLRGTSLTVADGSCTCVMGRNGVGKTTLLRAIMGLIPIQSGSVRFGDRELIGADASDRARVGIGYVPQGRAVSSSSSRLPALLRCGLRAFFSMSPPREFSQASCTSWAM